MKYPQTKMPVKFKKLMGGVPTPKYSRDGDAGIDLTAMTKKIEYVNNQCQYVYGTGIAVEIPEGYVGLIFPRSSIVKTNMTLGNAVGVIDSNFRGEITARFNTVNENHSYNLEVGHIGSYNPGDRICQLLIIPYPAIDLVEVDELSSTERGDQGYGSSGK
ncbi:MAG TPA: dUTP diphosphatase [Fervidobacterium sp.]|nr:dUTP diphosphatase [Fervidobacterium sp.]